MVEDGSGTVNLWLYSRLLLGWSAFGAEQYHSEPGSGHSENGGAGSIFAYYVQEML